MKSLTSVYRTKPLYPFYNSYRPLTQTRSYVNGAEHANDPRKPHTYAEISRQINLLKCGGKKMCFHVSLSSRLEWQHSTHCILVEWDRIVYWAHKFSPQQAVQKCGFHINASEQISQSFKDPWKGPFCLIGADNANMFWSYHANIF